MSSLLEKFRIIENISNAKESVSLSNFVNHATLTFQTSDILSSEEVLWRREESPRIDIKKRIVEVVKDYSDSGNIYLGKFFSDHLSQVDEVKLREQLAILKNNFSKLPAELFLYEDKHNGIVLCTSTDCNDSGSVISSNINGKKLFLKRIDSDVLF